MKIQPKFNSYNESNSKPSQLNAFGQIYPTYGANCPSFGMKILGKEKLNLALINKHTKAINQCWQSTESSIVKSINFKNLTEEFQKLKTIVNSTMNSIAKHNEKDSEFNVNAIIDKVNVVKSPLNGDLQLNLHIDNEVFIPINVADPDIAGKIQNVIMESAVRLN